MENTVMKNLIECMENTPEKTYDFIANNYWKMEKSELADVIKELLYAISYSVNTVLESEEKEILANAAEELKDNYLYEEV